MNIEKRLSLFSINHILEFDPEKKTLKRIDDNSISEVKLNGPTSECLYLILSNSSKIISQDEFFKNVWEVNGEYVSLNTLYQNISILRKSFKELGVDDEVITTVAKKGFKLHTDVRLSILERKVGETSEIVKNYNAQRKFHISNGIFSVFFLSIILILLLVTVFYQSEKLFLYRPIEVDSRYVETAKVADCHIYTFNMKRKKENFDINIIKRLITEKSIDCLGHGHLYVSWSEYSNYYSVVSCNKKITPDSIVDCSTVFYEG
jgi:DNA-binding winged helix-turn-helix (wHTH) protein